MQRKKKKVSDTNSSDNMTAREALQTLLDIELSGGMSVYQLLRRSCFMDGITLDEREKAKEKLLKNGIKKSVSLRNFSLSRYIPERVNTLVFCPNIFPAARLGAEDLSSTEKAFYCWRVRSSWKIPGLQKAITVRAFNIPFPASKGCLYEVQKHCNNPNIREWISKKDKKWKLENTNWFGV
jgi:hypothetical protein